MSTLTNERWGATRGLQHINTLYGQPLPRGVFEVREEYRSPSNEHPWGAYAIAWQNRGNDRWHNMVIDQLNEKTLNAVITAMHLSQ